EEGGYYLLDFANPNYQDHVAAQAKVVVESGVLDGVMLDWWIDDDDRLSLIRKVREAVGDDALIICNANDRQTPRTAPYINGYFMECYRSESAADWERIRETLAWAEANLREPRVNCVETWFQHSRQDLHLMRATTTMTLTHSDGFALFSDPNPLPTPDHLHDWYPFWDAPLGKPVELGFRRDDGAYQREFSGGTAVYNPMGNERVAVEFDSPRRSAASGETGTRHEIGSPDGDLFLRVEPDER
ncbi:MAG: putative glycoside hydrolase, partial [Candidatus Poribacteria bacterium]|nr:putative glycoside hydrolase [Candidatus Poribacteria bacterium]